MARTPEELETLKFQKTSDKVIYAPYPLQDVLAEVSDLFDCLIKDGVEFSGEELILLDRLESYAKLGNSTLS